MIIALTVNGEVFPLEEGHQCRMYLQGDSDSSPVYYPAEGFLDTEYNLVYFDLPQCSAGGKTLELRITKGAQIIYSPCWRLIVDESIGDDAAQQAGGGSVVYEEKLATAPETTGPLPSGAKSIYLDGSGNTKKTPFVGKVAVLNIDNGIDATVAQAAYNYIVGGYVVFLVYGGLSYPVWSAEYTSASSWDVMYLDDYSSGTAVMLVTQSGTQTYREYVKMSLSDWSTVMQLIFGKQDKLTFDNVPTMDSSNPVKSGGVYSALAGKQNTLTAGENITITGDTISAAGYTLPASTPTTLGGVKIDGTSLTTDASGVLHSKLIQIVDFSTSKSKFTPAEILSMWNEGYGFKLNQYTVVAIGVDSILSPTEAELILLTPLPKTRKAIVSADKSYVVGSAAADFSEVNFTTELNTKLAGIESGAEVNDVTDVQDKSGNSLVTNKIAKIQTVPTPTSADENKAIVVDSNGAYVLGTVGGGGGTASDITYDNTSSGLTATDVQDAIDELASNIPQGVLVGSTDSTAQDYVAPSEVIEAINGGREVIISVPNVTIGEDTLDISFVSWDTLAADYEGVTVNSSVYIESGIHKYIVNLTGLYATGLGDMWNAVSIVEIATKADLSNYQDKNYLVTYLSSACTDTQYPSAKVVYDTIGNVESILAELIGGTP